MPNNPNIIAGLQIPQQQNPFAVISDVLTIKRQQAQMQQQQQELADEQQVRALCGLPLGYPQAHSAAVMVNLLGDLWLDASGNTQEPAWATIDSPALKLHLYGKPDARPGRKMGHFTALGEDVEHLLRHAEQTRKILSGMHTAA